MNDRFKFRIWDTKSNVYIGSGSIDIRLGIFSTGNLLDAPRFKLEQCTGLKDKNGNLIYEGDILCYVDNKIAVVYDNEFPSFKLRVVDGSRYGQLSQEYVNSFGFEVIGNIHEKESK